MVKTSLFADQERGACLNKPGAVPRRIQGATADPALRSPQLLALNIVPAHFQQGSQFGDVRSL